MDYGGVGKDWGYMNTVCNVIVCCEKYQLKNNNKKKKKKVSYSEAPLKEAVNKIGEEDTSSHK